MAVVALSLAAALSFAIGVVMQQHAAAAQPIEHHLRPSLVVRLAQRPLWLGGVAACAVGTLLQLLALWHGTLVAVQPLLVCGLLFALPINAIFMHGRRPGTRELLCAGTVCVGLAAFLVATDPRPGEGSATAQGWAISLTSIGVAVAVLIASSLVSKGAIRSGLLACSAGVINGLSAAFTKGVARQLATGWHRGVLRALVGALSNWELYAFGATLLVVTVIVQSAFQTGPIRWSLPALTAANPVTSVLLGATVLGERVRSSDIALAGAAAGLLLVVTGILALSSSALLPGGAASWQAAPAWEGGQEWSCSPEPAFGGEVAPAAGPSAAATPVLDMDTASSLSTTGDPRPERAARRWNGAERPSGRSM